MGSVAKKAFDNRTRGLEGGVFKSGLLKMGIEGGGSLLQHFRYNIVTCHILEFNE